MSEQYRCHYCTFKTTTAARLSSHISQSPKCLNGIIADNQPILNPQKRHRSPTPPGVSGSPDDQPQPNDEPPYSSLLRGHTKRARVEVEEDAPFKFKTDTVFDEFDPPAGVPRARPVNMSNEFEHLRQNQRLSGSQPWTPFSLIEDWDYARWIMNSDLSQRQIDEMLALDFVSKTRTVVNVFQLKRMQIKSSSPSFHNNRALLSKIDSLPTGPKWEIIELSVEGQGVNDDGVVTDKVELWRRDPVECIRELFSNPAFRNQWCLQKLSHGCGVCPQSCVL
jgi:hypothetical protein